VSDARRWGPRLTRARTCGRVAARGASPRRLVRSVKLRPPAAAGAKAPSAPASSPAASWDLAAHARGGRCRRGSSVRGGDAVELVGRGAGPVEVSRGQGDVHLRGAGAGFGTRAGEPDATSKRSRDSSATALRIAVRAACPLPSARRRSDKRGGGSRPISCACLNASSAADEFAQSEADLPELVDHISR
jgi:hypothetical protein